MKIQLESVSFDGQGIVIHSPGLRRAKLKRAEAGKKMQGCTCAALWLQDGLIGMSYRLDIGDPGDKLGSVYTVFIPQTKIDHLVVAESLPPVEAPAPARGRREA